MWMCGKALKINQKTAIWIGDKSAGADASGRPVDARTGLRRSVTKLLKNSGRIRDLSTAAARRLGTAGFVHRGWRRNRQGLRIH